MTRSVEKDIHCTTYTYNVKDLSKEELLGYISMILHDDDITSHGVILTEPVESTDWPGDTKQLPFVPSPKVFAEYYKDVPITCVTAVMEYHGETLMLAYKPEPMLLSIILPPEFSADIEEIEQNVIPDQIDLNPGANIGE